MGRPGITGVRDLKGKSVGSGARGSDSSLLVEGWLEQNGLRPGTDVQVTYHAAQPDWARTVGGTVGMVARLLPTHGPAYRPLLGHESYYPLYEEAERLGCPLALHASVVAPSGPEVEPFEHTIESHTVIHPFSTSIAHPLSMRLYSPGLP